MIAFVLLASAPFRAHTPQQPPHQLFAEGDLKLESGEVIKDFSISYVVKLIAGTPRSDSAMLIKDMLMRSPVVSNISNSRRLGCGLI